MDIASISFDSMPVSAYLRAGWGHLHRYQRGWSLGARRRQQKRKQSQWPRVYLLIVARTHDDVLAGDLKKICCLRSGLLLSTPEVVIGNPA